MSKKYKIPKKATSDGYDLATIRMLLIGSPKIGKSTFASKFNGTLFFDSENGLKKLKVKKWKIKNWQTFCDMVDQITEDSEDIKTIIPDTISTLYKYCRIHCRKKYNMIHPSDFKWGKGWDLLKFEFETPILKLIASNLGLIFIAHEDEIEIKKQGNITITKCVANLSKGAREVIMPLVDIIGHIYMKEVGNKERRYITFAKSSENDAGDRTGLLPKRMPLKYSKFKKYFNEKGD